MPTTIIWRSGCSLNSVQYISQIDEQCSQQFWLQSKSSKLFWKSGYLDLDKCLWIIQHLDIPKFIWLHFEESVPDLPLWRGSVFCTWDSVFVAWYCVFCIWDGLFCIWDEIFEFWDNIFGIWGDIFGIYLARPGWCPEVVLCVPPVASRPLSHLLRSCPIIMIIVASRNSNSHLATPPPLASLFLEPLLLAT